MRVSIVPKDIFLFVGVGLICRAFNWPRARSSSVMVHGSGVHSTEAGSLLLSHFYNRTESDIQWLPPHTAISVDVGITLSCTVVNLFPLHCHFEMLPW